MRISLVVPVFNEEETIPIFYQAVRSERSLTGWDLEIVFINDGSSDATEQVAGALAIADHSVIVVNFSRNFGKEAALIAGLDHATGDLVIPIDVDLQDPIDVIPRLIERWEAGADVVLAKRIDRQADSYLKRRTAEAFYFVHNLIAEPRIESNVGDFRLMSRQVVDAIRSLPERKLFMKGLLSWVGFSTEIIEYKRAERVAGTGKFGGWKLWNLALEGITSFSTIPLRLWTYLGLLIAVAAFIQAGWVVIDKIVYGNPVAGYPSLMSAVSFFAGVQLIGIGVLGEYVGRIYMEAKQRPRYIVRDLVSSRRSPVPAELPRLESTGTR